MTVGPCHRVVFVDDDADVRDANRQSLALAGFDVTVFADGAAALAAMTDDFAGVVVTDLRMPGIDGLELFRRLRTRDIDLPVILISGHADIATAVGAMQGGAYDVLAKPYSPALLVASVGRALEKRTLVLENRLLRAGGGEDPDGWAAGPLIGQSPAIEHLRRTIAQIADVPVDVLIEGETGTGKGVVAAMLHAKSARAARPMVTVDCGALPDAMVESELFGHVSGAFAGAQHSRIGRIEQAHRGTLFLDTIDLMRDDVQLKLQRVLETRAVTPLGANASRAVDLRVVAASNADLGELARTGGFRASLFYRINGVTLRLPPLRERRDDIVPLFRVFASRAAARLRRDVPTLTPAVWRRLADHDWPGNVRELMRYAETIALGLDDDDGATARSNDDLKTQVSRFETSVIETVLAATGGDVRQSLVKLGVPRKTFYDKIVRLGIDLGRFRGGRT